MSPEGRRIIQLAREARTPTVADRRRIRAAVALGVAAAAATAPASAAAGASAKAAGALGVLTGLRGVISVLAIASTSVGAGAYVWVHAHATRPVEAPVAPAPAELAPAPTQAEVSAPAVPVASPVVVEHPNEARSRARTSPQDPLAAELTLLQSAKQAWREGRPQTALDLVQRHAQLYPRSQLASERDALKVFALCGVGRTNDARELGASLLAREPGSPFRASIEQSCAMLPPK